MNHILIALTIGSMLTKGEKGNSRNDKLPSHACGTLCLQVLLNLNTLPFAVLILDFENALNPFSALPPSSSISNHRDIRPHNQT